MGEKIGKAGRFTVNLETGSVVGPAEYMNSAHYAESMAKIQNGQCAVLNYAPPGIPFAQLVAVALQTYYAGWCGQKEMESWTKNAAKA